MDIDARRVVNAGRLNASTTPRSPRAKMLDRRNDSTRYQFLVVRCPKNPLETDRVGSMRLRPRLGSALYFRLRFGFGLIRPPGTKLSTTALLLGSACFCPSKPLTRGAFSSCLAGADPATAPPTRVRAPSRFQKPAHSGFIAPLRATQRSTSLPASAPPRSNSTLSIETETNPLRASKKRTS